jgi:hypothetical protein
VSPATDPGLVINWNPVTETWRNLKLAHGNVVVFRSLLGISWMWFFGAVFLAQFPSFARDVLHGNEGWPRCCWWCFRSASASGRCCARCCRKRHVEIGLVPLGAIGMSVFASTCTSHRALPCRRRRCRWPSSSPRPRTGACWPTWRCCRCLPASTACPCTR